MTPLTLRTLAAGVLLLPPCVLAQTDWTKLAPAVRPPKRAWMAMTYDLARQKIVLTGGFENVTGLPLADTWEWDGASWKQVPATTSPARDCMSMAYAITSGRVVLFGGLDAGFARLGDTWEYDGANWTLVTTSGPSARVYMTLAYDAGRDRVVGFGGGNRGSFADTWEYDPVAKQWAQIMTPTTPPSREDCGLVYDFDRGVIVMHAGWDNATNAILTDTWEYDGVDWTQVNTPAAPPPRICFGMVYDTLRDRVIMHGGADLNFTTNFGDTWEYDGTTWRRLTPLTAGPAIAGLAMAYDIANQRTIAFGGEDAPTGVDSDDTWALRTVNPAAVIPLGTGCAGSGGVPALSTDALPWIGTTPSLWLDNLPAAPGNAAFLLGFSATRWGAFSLPLPLGFVGLTGCDLLVSVDASAAVAHPGSVVSLPLPIPTDRGLIGLNVHGQGLSVDSAASNGIGATSVGVTMVVGSR